MPSPIAHTLAGQLVAEACGARVGRRRWLSTAVVALVANLPDIDWIPGYLAGIPSAYHHYWTHSVAAALAVAALAGGIARCRGLRAVPAATTFGAVYLSHVVLDFLMSDVQLLWPLSDEFVRFAWPLLPALDLPPTSDGFFMRVLTWRNALVVAWEVVVFLPPLVALAVLRAVSFPGGSREILPDVPPAPPGN